MTKKYKIKSTFVGQFDGNSFGFQIWFQASFSKFSAKSRLFEASEWSLRSDSVVAINLQVRYYRKIKLYLYFGSSNGPFLI
jgi:hypothetical protein